MMTLILRTITCQAAQRTYALACDGSGRELLRLLAAEANAASTATSATISAKHPSGRDHKNPFM
eukprot:2546426-Pleurochrysis_carterae.AAC.1